MTRKVINVGFNDQLSEQYKNKNASGVVLQYITTSSSLAPTRSLQNTASIGLTPATSAEIKPVITKIIQHASGVFAVGSSYSGSVGDGFGYTVFSSSDWGDTWQLIDFTSSFTSVSQSNCANSIVIDKSGAIYVAGSVTAGPSASGSAYTYGVIRKSHLSSTNSWTTVFLPAPPAANTYVRINDICTDSNDIIYAVGTTGSNTTSVGTDALLWKSSDRGTTWIEVEKFRRNSTSTGNRNFGTCVTVSASTIFYGVSAQSATNPVIGDFRAIIRSSSDGVNFSTVLEYTGSATNTVNAGDARNVPNQLFVDKNGLLYLALREQISSVNQTWYSQGILMRSTR